MEKQKIEQKPLWNTGNPHTFLAPELENNGVMAKIEDQRIQNIQIKAQRAMVTDQFKVGYPAYQTILEKYTPSMIFGGNKKAQRDLSVASISHNHDKSTF